jgi:hypothetical protein
MLAGRPMYREEGCESASKVWEARARGRLECVERGQKGESGTKKAKSVSSNLRALRDTLNLHLTRRLTSFLPRARTASTLCTACIHLLPHNTHSLSSSRHGL